MPHKIATCTQCRKEFEYNSIPSRPTRTFCGMKCIGKYRSDHPAEFRPIFTRMQEGKTHGHKFPTPESFYIEENFHGMPWNKKENEPNDLFTAFQIYLERGVGRSIETFFIKYGERGKNHFSRLADLTKVAQHWQWDMRADAYDKYVNQKRTDEWVQRQVTLDEMNWNDGLKLRTAAMEALSKANLTESEVKDVVAVLKLATDMMGAPLAGKSWTQDNVKLLMESLPMSVRPMIAKVFYAELSSSKPEQIVNGEGKLLE